MIKKRELMMRREAEALLPSFTEAPNGAAVMDGEGRIWHYSGGYWHSEGHPASPVAPLTLAKALCPDLAEEFDKLAAEVSTC